MRRMVVNGEQFEVTERVREPAVYDLRWASGANADYGFATSTYSVRAKPTLN